MAAKGKGKGKRSIDKIQRNIICRGCGQKGRFEREYPNPSSTRAASGNYAWAFNFMNSILGVFSPKAEHPTEDDEMQVCPLQFALNSEFDNYVAIMDSGCTMTCALSGKVPCGS